MSVVGDFKASELEDLVRRYVGTVRPRPAPLPLHMHPIVFRDPPTPERHQTWHLKVRCAALASPGLTLAYGCEHNECLASPCLQTHV